MTSTVTSRVAKEGGQGEGGLSQFRNRSLTGDGASPNGKPRAAGPA
jgi:hypothetical protein